ncbi:site-specific integrase [Limosilactobacillus reuteri]|jgi:integrase|uniref:tyrosine-type recombinase/integrase n=1 Tax=Limosilactobacillus reuteri TaxID=1598 RepID=UPI00214C99DD|nr:site-specific integrase [Limosilactobacillus reuteri]MCR1879546.1 site-specific integrase [Limosilactobacillus reuteri]
MWVEKYTVRGKVRYRFGENYKSPLTGKYKKVSVSYLKNNNQTKKAAAIELAKKIEKAKQKEYFTDKDISLRNLADKFLTIYKQRVAVNTYYNAFRGLKRICNDLGNDTLANKITTEILNRYLDQKLYDPDKPLTNASIQNYKKYLSMTYKFGVKYGYLKKNPVKDVEITWRSEIKRKRDRIENKYLTDGEYHAILHACEEKGRNDIKLFLEWLYLTGMRCGEAAGLYVKDIIKEEGKYKAIIDGSLSHQRELLGTVSNPTVKVSVKKTDGAKTIASNREVLLPQKAVNIYKKLSLDKDPNDLIFINKDSRSNRPFDASHLDRFLHRLEAGAKIDKSVTTHFFRHTHVSKLAELGVPLYVIKNHVGHENSKITEEIYLHVTKEMEESLADKLSKL